MHACDLAEAMAIPTVMIPARPGALSAFGILASDVVKDYSRTVLWTLSGHSLVEGRRAFRRAKLEKEFRELETTARKELRTEGWSGILRSAVRYERSLDLRYRGQGYELNVPAFDAAIEKVTSRFHQEHQRSYGYHHAGREIELVTLRLRVRLRTPPLRNLSKSARLRRATERATPRRLRCRNPPLHRQQPGPPRAPPGSSGGVGLVKI